MMADAEYKLDELSIEEELSLQIKNLKQSSKIKPVQITEKVQKRLVKSQNSLISIFYYLQIDELLRCQ